ncbi:MAG: TAT-variant-translocated molybdopterin oxidoreductase [Phycisphaerales bacterium]|nr:TAT-variant-translocated molybdopterin oxidoreductase [Phycisphaerales bacterium]
MPAVTRNDTPGYWRSLDELADTPEFRQFVEAEFPGLAPELKASTSRRRFLQVMGASFALAGLTGCRWPKELIVPATQQPVNRIPGEPVEYATALELDGVATGLLATSYDGRPVKVDGNDKHPFSRGRSNTFQQASILSLYDPDRSTRLVERRLRGSNVDAITRSWREFTGAVGPHFQALRGAGAGMFVLATHSPAPTFSRLRREFTAAFPEARWVEYQPLARDHEIDGAILAFGRPLRAIHHLERAAVIVSLDADFLVRHPASVRYAADFAEGRHATDGRMSRLWSFETTNSVTGSVADERVPLRPSEIEALARHLHHVIADGPAPEVKLPLSPARFDDLVADLRSHQGRAVVLVGTGQPGAVHAVAHALNTKLDATGKTVTYVPEPAPPNMAAAWEELASKVIAREVGTLLILGGNPLADAPATPQFRELFLQIPLSIHLSLYDNETSQACAWHLPELHYLEAWADARAWDGTASIVQPLIAPLFEGRSEAGRTPAEVLAMLLGLPENRGHDLVRTTFRSELAAGAADSEEAWREALHDGVVANSGWITETPALRSFELPAPGRMTDGFELAFCADYSVHDGRFANNSWLQEWPDPITKLTWDNAALIAPADAATMGLRRNGEVVRVLVGGRELEIAAYILPGHAVGAVTLPLGYGRGAGAGAVAEGVGFDTFRLRSALSQYSIGGARLEPAGRLHKLVGTQDHHAIRSAVGDKEIQRRIPELFREATLKHYQSHPDFAAHVVHLPQLESLWQERAYNDHKWGMTIDLSACIGCGTCVVACQAENNIPVVGKDEVAMGREMHWIRVDRYFQGEPTAPNVRVVHQPVACVHCENAPCEQVCPVAATVHDTEGLNVMVYNRCIGTRYCSNNCPYKVRRFNWFYNHHGPHHPRSQGTTERSTKGGVNIFPGELKKQPVSDLEKMVFNPEVTVRTRGVMEKCTYCTQRITRAKIKMKNRHGWSRIPDGLITPACAQACPTGAIVFGDLNDPESRVAKLQTHSRSYGLLAELNTKPRTTYLARLRNPVHEPATGYGDVQEHT